MEISNIKRLLNNDLPVEGQTITTEIKQNLMQQKLTEYGARDLGPR
jgi:hypothetical protein